MRLLVAVPSYNRPYQIEKRTGYWLKQLKEFDYKVFVEPSEALYYAQSIGTDNIVETNDNNGLYGQLIDIGQYTIENGYDLVTKIDDDTYYTNDVFKKKDASKVIEQSLKEIVNRFRSVDNLGAIAFSRGMDYFYNKGIGFKPRYKGIYGTCVCKPEILVKLNRQYKCFADLMISLKSREMGFDNETYYNCTENSVMLTNEGGLQSMDRMKISSETLDMILRDYPEAKEIHGGKYEGKIKDIDLNFYFKK